MKVLVTGATGFLGSEIVRRLEAEGHAARVLVRKTSKLDGLRGLDVEKVEGDILDRASIDRALAGVDAVIHTAGCVSARPRDRELIYRVNVDGTRNVLEAALARGGLRVVHTASIAAVGATDEPVLQNEESPWLVGDVGYHYVASKRRGEELALELAKKGLDVLSLDPGMILGPGDVYFTSTRFVLEYLRGVNRLYTRGGISFCDVRDVAAAHVAALTRGRAGERYIVAGMNFTYREALEALHRITGVGRPYPLPYAVAYAAALLSEFAARFREHPYEEVSRPFIKFSARYAFCDAAKAARELGYQVRPFEDSLRDTVKDFLDRGIVEPTTPALRALAGAATGVPAAAAC
jgi:dihydroflavonol-4-reductase